MAWGQSVHSTFTEIFISNMPWKKIRIIDAISFCPIIFLKVRLFSHFWCIRLCGDMGTCNTASERSLARGTRRSAWANSTSSSWNSCKFGLKLNRNPLLFR